MNAIKGTVKNRQVVVEVPPDWPEGCEVVVEPIAALKEDEDDEGPPTSEVIAARLAFMDQLEPDGCRPKTMNTIVVSSDSDLSAVPGLTVENWVTA